MTQLATTKQTINLPILADPVGVAEVMRENLEGLTAAFPKIKFPSGGMLAFEVPSDDGSDVAKELTGVIIDRINTNTYWSKKFDGTTNTPDCSSADGKVGRRSPEANLPWQDATNVCSTCTFNQYGSGEDGRGKACKNNVKLFMVREGEILPVEILVPPSSLKALNTYIIQLTTKIKTLDAVVTKIKLRKATSGSGIEYSEAIFQKAADLTQEERQAIRKYSHSIKSAVRLQAEQVISAPIDSPIETDDEELPF